MKTTKPRRTIMDIPKTNFNPPFRFGRASHLTFTVRDLARSHDFYTKVVGLVVSDDDRDTLFLRGVEERAHHSLVLKRTNSAPACVRTGLRPRRSMQTWDSGSSTTWSWLANPLASSCTSRKRPTTWYSFGARGRRCIISAIS